MARDPNLTRTSKPIHNTRVKTDQPYGIGCMVVAWQNTFFKSKAQERSYPGTYYCLILILGSTEHQLVRYSFAQFNIIEYDIEARGASKFIQLNENVSLFVQYHVRFGDTKENIYILIQLRTQHT